MDPRNRLAVCLLASVALFPAVSLIFAALLLFSLYFFGIPSVNRRAMKRSLSPLRTGVVVEVKETGESQFINQRVKRVTIFLSVFDVHVNRAPIAGEITHSEPMAGRFLDARNPASSRPTRAVHGPLREKASTIVVRQITGAIARRICAWKQVGDVVTRGERFGMIRFGSRTEVDLPLETEILVKPGERVRGGKHPSPGSVRNRHELSRRAQDLSSAELNDGGKSLCGFAAVLRIIEAALVIQQGGSAVTLYHQALTFILGACVFDLLDGRLARLGGNESPFGREFDSLADVVSFGMAPALLVYQIVLRDFQRTGWLIAFVYLLCGTLRLARFNCYASAKNGKPKDDFIGFPIPAAAGLIASLTLFMLWLEEGAKEIGVWKYALAAP